MTQVSGDGKISKQNLDFVSNCFSYSKILFHFAPENLFQTPLKLMVGLRHF